MIVGETYFAFLIIEQIQNKISSSKSIAVGLTKYSKRGLRISSICCKKFEIKYSCSAMNLIVFQHLFILMFDLLVVFFFLDELLLIFKVLPFVLSFVNSFSILYTKELKKTFKFS